MKTGLWDQGVYSRFCDTRESPPSYMGVDFGVRPFLLYHRSGPFPQPWLKQMLCKPPRGAPPRSARPAGERARRAYAVDLGADFMGYPRRNCRSWYGGGLSLAGALLVLKGNRKGTLPSRKETSSCMERVESVPKESVRGVAERSVDSGQTVGVIDDLRDG